MSGLPTGTLTFLFTDIVGSSRLWERDPAAMRAAVVRHDALAEAAVAAAGGVIVRPRGEGDSRFAVFRRATDALVGASDLQRALHAEPWLTEEPLRVRAAVHTGDADLIEGDYYGPAVNRCARLRGLAHGGQILASAGTAQLARDHLPPGMGLRPLGVFRLRDLQRPEAIYQLEHPDLPAEFPPLVTLDAFRHNLPVQLTSFIGREAEVEELQALLAVRRLVTVSGTGGCGKTRLALQVAAEVIERFPDGVWLVELGALADAGLVAQAVAGVLGVREQPGRPLVATLVDALRDRRLLLVLDTCEHLVEACAHLVEALLRACPDVRVLATSREALGVAGETTWRVPSLALPSDNGDLLDAAMHAPSVRLFAERAAAATRAFQLTDRNAAAVVQLCRRLDGIPLAIELAAARVPMLSVEEIARRLDDRFTLLTRGHRTSLPRQQTLRATMDWSYGLLAPDERVLFRRLAVFVNGWTLTAAEAVCGGDGPLARENVLDLLGRLVDKSLVNASTSGDGGEPRYAYPETVRAYAAEKLAEAGETADLRRRHRDEMLRLVQEAEPRLRSPDQDRWIGRLKADLDNIRAALEWSRTDDTTPRASLALAGSLWWFWYTQGTLTEGRVWLEDALGRAPAAPTPERAGALYGTAAIVWSQGDFGRAAVLAQDALGLCREFDDRLGVLYCLAILGAVALGRGGYDEAMGMLEEAAGLCRPDGDPWETAMVRGLLGWTLSASGAFERAAGLLHDSLARFRALGDAWGAASVLVHLGRTLARLGDAAQARTCLEDGIGLARGLGNRVSLAAALHELAWVDLAAGALETAEAHEREAMRLRRDQGERTGVAECLEGAARLALARGEAALAVRCYSGAAAVREEIGSPVPAADRAALEADLARLRERLGEGVFRAAWAEGERLGPDAFPADRRPASDAVS